MPNKLQAYAEQAERTARQITGSHLAWTAFLTTAARLYKYPYNEQLMIYMQRPEATACAEYDFWNGKMGRYVRRGSTGIALIDASGYKPRLKYVFDVSDTGGKENARRVNLWGLKDAHTDSVSAMLERNYGVSGKNGLAEQFESVASQLAAEYWRDHSRDILGIVADSYLEEYDDYNIEVAFKNAAVVSITYSLMSRCGMQPEDHFEHEDFFSIFDFNTPRTVAALGTAVSEINEQVLRQIEVTIRNYEREHSAERTAEHGEQPDLHDERRLPDPRPEDRGAGAAPRQVRTDAPEVPEGASPHSLESDDLGGGPVPAPAGDRAGGAEPSGADDAGAGGGGRSDGSSESQRPIDVGGPDEHLQGAGGGSDSRGADLRITEHPARGGQLSFFPTEAEQITAIEEAESAQTPFAFSVSQAQLDHVLRLGGNEDDTRMVIAAAFQKQKSVEDIAALLQSTFHGGNGFKTPECELSVWYAVDGIHIAPGRSAEYVRSAQVIAWQDAAVRISQLMDSGAYASNVELAEAGQHERMQLAQALWYLKHDLSDEAREQGYLSCMDTLRGGGFPDETARLAEQLTNTDFRETLSGEFAQFYAAHEQDRSLLRFHYHKLDQIWQSLRDLSLPRRAYSSEMAAVPELGRFITEDEIDHALDRGSGVEGGKGRIYEYFTGDHTGKEKAAFLKDEYGIGGRSHAVSGASHSDESHDSHGIVLKKAGCANVELSWTKVAARIDSLIQKDRFLSPREKERYAQLQREKEAERELPTQSQTDYNAVKEAHPDDLVLFQVGDFFEIYGEDAKQAAELLDLNLTTRAIPGSGRVAMCGVPAHSLERYAERGIVGGRIVDAEAHNNSPFIRQVMADVERIAAQEAQAAHVDSPDRFSIRLHPNEGGITGIWDSALDRFYEEGGQVLRFAEQSNAIDYLSSIQRSRGMEPDAPVFTTPLGNAYRVGDGFSSTAAEQRDTLMVVERVDEDNVWYTLPSVPEQETVSVDRTVFERYLDTGYFFAAEQTQPVKEVTAENEQENMIFRAPYAVGDTVYLDNTPFEITEVGALNVQLRDPALRFSGGSAGAGPDTGAS